MKLMKLERIAPVMVALNLAVPIGTYLVQRWWLGIKPAAGTPGGISIDVIFVLGMIFAQQALIFHYRQRLGEIWTGAKNPSTILGFSIVFFVIGLLETILTFMFND